MYSCPISQHAPQRSPQGVSHLVPAVYTRPDSGFTCTARIIVPPLLCSQVCPLLTYESLTAKSCTSKFPWWINPCYCKQKIVLQHNRKDVFPIVEVGQEHDLKGHWKPCFLFLALIVGNDKMIKAANLRNTWVIITVFGVLYLIRFYKNNGSLLSTLEQEHGYKKQICQKQKTNK